MATLDNLTEKIMDAVNDYSEQVQKELEAKLDEKNKGMIVHLIEFGFMHRSGSYVNPRPFLRPAFDAFTPKMLEDIKGIINGK